MAEFSIGEVEGLTGLKAHVLRYWEETIPFIRPRKDDRGRRVYTSRDVDLILRVKHLVQERKYTLEGAGERLVVELTGSGPADAGESGPGFAGTEPIDDAAPAADPAPSADSRLSAARAAIDELRANLLELYGMVKKRDPGDGDG